MDDIFGLLSQWSYIQFLQSTLMDHYNALEALGKGLKFKVSAPFSALTHCFEIVIEGTVFILIEKRPEKLLILGHEAACFFPHDQVRSFGSV